MPIEKAMSGDLKAILLITTLTAVGGGSGSMLTNVMHRPDALTEMKNFVVAADELQDREWKLRVREIEQGIRRDMPPQATRDRVRYIEAYLQGKEPLGDFDPPTYDWQ